MTETEIIVQQLKASLNRFFQLVEFMGLRVKAWQNYLAILESKNLLPLYNRRWSAFAKSKELGSILAQDVARFEEEKSRNITFIKSNNPRLGGKIDKFKAIEESIKPVLANLLLMLNKDRSWALGYIKTHSKELIAWIDSLNIKDKEKLRELIIEISGDEVTELSKCIADIERWSNFRINNNLQFFIDRVFVYLRGGRFENEFFAGLVRYFKDKSFINEIKESNALRMLLTYQKFLQFFKDSRNIVAYSIERPGWEGFRGKNGWFNNLIKRENYIQTIRDRFGNKEIATLMEQMYETTGEYPEGWLKNMDTILARIKHPSYQNTYVIVPAANDLLSLLEKKRQELLGESVESKLDKLQNIIRKDFESIIKKSRNLRLFQAILNEEQRLLERETEEEKREIKRLLTTYGMITINFFDAGNALIASSEEDIHKKITAYLRLRMSELKTLKQMRSIKGNSDDPRYAVALYAALLRYDKSLSEIDRWVELVRLSGLSNLKYEAEEIESALLKEEDLKNSAAQIDNQLVSVKNNYFTFQKNEKNVTLVDPDYVELEEQKVER